MKKGAGSSMVGCRGKGKKGLMEEATLELSTEK